ncbi:hypothetical protein Sjap_013021 [Stephania japonica]|uniref:Uncharacterized protein n=1 Tax=Stephania japonica TaxID=461633 RepID=A0AAP0IX87_9MAGN
MPISMNNKRVEIGARRRSGRYGTHNSNTGTRNPSNDRSSKIDLVFHHEMEAKEKGMSRPNNQAEELFLYSTMDLHSVKHKKDEFHGWATVFTISLKLSKPRDLV